MKILLDHCVPQPFRHALLGCEVRTAHEMGWSRLRNGELLRAAATAGFDAFVTVDQGFAHQQNKDALPIAVILIRVQSNDSDVIIRFAPQVLAALERLVQPLESPAKGKPLIIVP